MRMTKWMCGATMLFRFGSFYHEVITNTWELVKEQRI